MTLATEFWGLLILANIWFAAKDYTVGWVFFAWAMATLLIPIIIKVTS